ncbi:MAG TPA: hypothetical protein PK156_12490 [Polyangium sp.]|nr:hypothetical protein [Polyangium sp.]
MQPFRLFVRAVAFLAATFSVEVAFAQPATVDPIKVAQAQRIYDEALTLMDAQQHALACPKLEEVTNLLPEGFGGHLVLAECYEALGRFGSAWEELTVAEALAHAKGKPKEAADVAALTKALEPKVSKLEIRVPPEIQGVPGLTVWRDGKKTERDLWDKPLPADIGKHVISVEAPTRQTWTQEVDILGDGTQVQVNVPVLQLKIISPPPSSAPPPSVPQLRMAMNTGSLSRTWQKPLGWTTFGLAGGSFVATSILAKVAADKQEASNWNGHCDAMNYCDPIGMSLRNQSFMLANAGTAMFALGGALLVTGVVIVATSPQRVERKTTSWSWQVHVGPRAMGVRADW